MERVTYLKAITSLERASALAAREGVLAAETREVEISKLVEVTLGEVLPVKATLLLVVTDVVIVVRIVEGLCSTPVEVCGSRLQEHNGGQKASTYCDHNERWGG